MVRRALLLCLLLVGLVLAHKKLTKIENFAVQHFWWMQPP